MRSAMFFCTALFASGTALADDIPVPATTGESTPVAGESNVPAPPPHATPAPIPPPPAPVAVAMTMPVPEGPEPAIGWGRGRRAPMYVSLMLGAGIMGEDSNNRLTTRDSKALEGVTGILRIGATLSEHSRIGARLQSFVRPTKKLVYETPPADGSTDKWGAVSFGYVGPEYIYTTDFGLYFGGSVGLAAAVSRREIEDDDSKYKHDDDHDDIERGAGGLGGMLSLGYEWRVSKWFAMNAELFGGGYSGIDDNDDSMKGGIFGFAMGAGF